MLFSSIAGDPSLRNCEAISKRGGERIRYGRRRTRLGHLPLASNAERAPDSRRVQDSLSAVYFEVLVSRMASPS